MATMLLALSVLVVMAVPRCAAEGSSSPTEEMAAATAWYDQLEWPDVHRLPYMEFTMTTPKWDVRWSSGRKIRGFLVSEDDRAYRAFCDGALRRIFKHPTDGEGGLPASARKLGPTAAVDDEIADLRRPRAEGGAFPRPNAPSPWIRTYQHLFVLSRCFARQGRTDLAEKLDKELVLAMGKRPVQRISQEPDLRVAIEKWIFDDVIRESIHDFDDLDLSRRQLLAQFERIAHGFSAADKAGLAQKFADQLRAMIVEEKAHTKSTRPFETMSEAERVSELIFRLRDENGLQRSRTLRSDWRETDSFVRDPLGPASLSIRGSPSPTGKDDSPARQLIRLGPAAVPALIAALGNPGLTRSVEVPEAGEQMMNTSTAVLTVGECVETVLYYISGRHFGSNRRETRSGDAVRAEVLQWWSDRQTQGEKQTLTEGVGRGDEESLEQARHLVAIDADAAVAALSAGIAAAKSTDIRTDLTRELGMVKTDTAARALRNQMKSGAHLGDRIAAAAELWQRGDGGVVASMIGEWERWEPSAFQPPSEDQHDTLELIDFLSACGETTAMKALDRRFASLPSDVKLTVLHADATIAFDEETGRKTMPAEFDALREDLLVKALDDTAREFMGGATRVCDMAARALADRWPDRYPFKDKQTLVERDVAIAGLRNTWRSSRGLPPLPAPKPLPPLAAGLDHNCVAACEWVGGPALEGTPTSVGQPLTTEAIINTILYLHRNLPHDCFGFVLSAERGAGQAGIVVRMEWYRGERPESPAHEACYSTVWLDSQTSAQLFSRDGPKEGANPKQDDWSREMLEPALHFGIDRPVSFVCGWLWEKTLLPSPEMGSAPPVPKPSAPPVK
jgi:hypothetical protein